MDSAKNLSLYTFREIVSYMVDHPTPTDENDASSSITPLDYSTLYKAFDLLDAMGFLGRKTDVSSAKQVEWLGFSGLKKKFIDIIEGKVNVE